jgi:dTDP-D-glucose 4,6-dehydratase
LRTVLITGAAGFLGQHIGNHFGAEGWKILATDKEFPKYIKFSGWELFPLALPSRELEGILTEKKPDVLVHCAGKSSVAESIQNPIPEMIPTEIPISSIKQYKKREGASRGTYGSPESFKNKKRNKFNITAKMR